MSIKLLIIKLYTTHLLKMLRVILKSLDKIKI